MGKHGPVLNGPKIPELDNLGTAFHNLLFPGDQKGESMGGPSTSAPAKIPDRTMIIDQENRRQLQEQSKRTSSQTLFGGAGGLVDSPQTTSTTLLGF